MAAPLQVVSKILELDRGREGRQTTSTEQKPGFILEFMVHTKVWLGHYPKLPKREIPLDFINIGKIMHAKPRFNIILILARKLS